MVLVTSALAADAQKPAGSTDKAAPIRASADTFTKAFNAGDAKAVAALWITDGTETDEQGETFKGRQAIEGEYAKLFKAHPDARIQIEVHSIDLPAPNVAVEDGVATVVTKSTPPSASRYTAVHVLQNGQWLMANVHESPADLKTGASSLQALEWLVGRWQAKSDDIVAESDIHWLSDKTFLERVYTVRKNGAVVSSGKQIIGWDPQEGQIRSWSFDSSGGYGTGLWSQTADGWQIDHTGTLLDSTPTSRPRFCDPCVRSRQRARLALHASHGRRISFARYSGGCLRPGERKTVSRRLHLPAINRQELLHRRTCLLGGD